jgi:hypothetical protein
MSLLFHFDLSEIDYKNKFFELKLNIFETVVKLFLSSLNKYNTLIHENNHKKHFSGVEDEIEKKQFKFSYFEY